MICAPDNSGDQPGSAKGSRCSNGAGAAGIEEFCGCVADNCVAKQQNQPALALASPTKHQVGEGGDARSSISDTNRHGASGAHSPSRNGANKDGDDATTRHAVHPSNAKSIRSTNTALLPVERRQRYRSPRRRASPGRAFSSLYLLDACQLTA